MAITIHDLSEYKHELDSTTGVSSDQSLSAFSSQPDPMESTNCLGHVVSKTNAYVVTQPNSLLGRDMGGSGEMFYCWVFQRGAPLSTANGGLGFIFVSGISPSAPHTLFFLAGSDKKAFTHDSGNPYFQCMMMDTARRNDIPDQTNPFLNQAPDYGKIIVVGGWCDNGTAKATGGTENYFWDVMRINNSGIYVTGGTNSSPGTFGQIANEDASNADDGAMGVCRELGAGLFGCQGPLRFGDASINENAIFNASKSVLVFEDRWVCNDKFKIDVQGNSSYINKFYLTSSTIKSAGPAVRCNFNGGEIDNLELRSTTFAGLRNGIHFSDLADASGHYVDLCTFNQCHTVRPGDVNFTNNTLVNPTSSGTGAVLFDGGTDNVSGLSFISGGAGHAVYIDTSGYYTFTNFSYTGYGSTGTTDAVVHNDCGGPVSINISGGTNPTYYNNAAGSTTTIVSSVPVSVKVIDEAGDPIENAQVAIYDNSQVQWMNEDTLATGFATEDYTGTTPATVTLRVRKGSAGTTRYVPNSTAQTIDSDGLTVTITLIEDPINTFWIK